MNTNKTDVALTVRVSRIGLTTTGASTFNNKRRTDMITKQMLARCQNELKQAFCALDKDVQEAIMKNTDRLQLLCSGVFCYYVMGKKTKLCDEIVRLSPDTPTEPEYEERIVVVGGIGKSYGLYGVGGDSLGDLNSYSVAHCVVHPRFIGIIYRDKDGKETLRTSVDAAFGTPVRVRFAKDYDLCPSGHVPSAV